MVYIYFSCTETALILVPFQIIVFMDAPSGEDYSKKNVRVIQKVQFLSQFF